MVNLWALNYLDDLDIVKYSQKKKEAYYVNVNIDVYIYINKWNKIDKLLFGAPT